MSRNHNTVGDMVSAKIWGRFWCMQYRLWQPCRFETTQCNSLVNSSNWVLQVQVVDQTTHPPKCHSFVGLDRQIGSSPPALNLALERERTKEEKEREKFYIYLDVTHTHPARAGSTLKGKRKKKADTRRANGQKQRRGGGEQTDLRNQPTRRNGPDKNSAHT